MVTRFSSFDSTVEIELKKEASIFDQMKFVEEAGNLERSRTSITLLSLKDECRGDDFTEFHPATLPKTLAAELSPTAAWS